MKVIIKKTKEIKEVSFGYAVNFLLPQNLALALTKKNLEFLKKEKQNQLKKQRLIEKENQDLVKKLANKTFTLKVKAGKKKIFGSITKKDIIKILKVKADKVKVLLEKPIKKLGKYNIDLKIGNQKTTIKVEVKNEN